MTDCVKSAYSKLVEAHADDVKQSYRMTQFRLHANKMEGEPEQRRT